MCDMVWCCCAMSGVKCVMRCGMVVGCMGNALVCRDARCEMWLWNTEWYGMVWCHIRHGVMWNEGWNAVWDVWCGLECVMCNLYLNVVMCMVWSRMWVWCGMGAEWFNVKLWCAVKCDVWNATWCGMLLFQTWCNVKCDWNANVWCEIWHGVDCGVLVCGMLQWNARCGKLRNVKCGGVKLWWWTVAYAMYCVMSDVENDVVVWCEIKMWWCNVEYGVVWNVL